jgi:hypothetical protein
MGRKLKALPKFASWEEEDEFWSTYSVTELNLEEDSTPLIVEPGALRSVKVITVANPCPVRSWKKIGIMVTREGLFIPARTL